LPRPLRRSRVRGTAGAQRGGRCRGGECGGRIPAWPPAGLLGGAHGVLPYFDGGIRAARPVSCWSTQHRARRVHALSRHLPLVTQAASSRPAPERRRMLRLVVGTWPAEVPGPPEERREAAPGGLPPMPSAASAEDGPAGDGVQTPPPPPPPSANQLDRDGVRAGRCRAGADRVGGRHREGVLVTRPTARRPPRRRPPGTVLAGSPRSCRRQDW
jgi:hypothetical protein